MNKNIYKWTLAIELNHTICMEYQQKMGDSKL